MRLLALDISSKCGWALFVDSKLEKYGKVSATAPVLAADGKDYPWNLVDSINKLATQIQRCVIDNLPDVVVIENTNLGRQRTTQRFLEWLHLAVLERIQYQVARHDIKYINSSDWRSKVDMKKSAEDRKNNRLISEIKRKAKKLPKEERQKFINKLKKEYGITGRITLKHLSVRLANERYELDLKQGQNDEADAMLLGQSHIDGVEHAGHY